MLALWAWKRPTDVLGKSKKRPKKQNQERGSKKNDLNGSLKLIALNNGRRDGDSEDNILLLCMRRRAGTKMLLPYQRYLYLLRED
jgi:hypothetical protein